MKFRYTFPGIAPICLLAWGCTASAQPVDGDSMPDEPIATASPITLTAAPVYTPLDLRQKYFFSLNEMAGPTQWVGFAVHAAMDQFNKAPIAWGNGEEGFAVRLANHFGRSFSRENIAFGVRYFDHEDPRYFRLGTGSSFKRTSYALARTVVARRDTGVWMPAFSRLIADYSTPFLAQTWRPERFSVGRGFRQGSVAIGMGFGSNLWEEFGPDLKQRFKRRPKAASLPLSIP